MPQLRKFCRNYLDLDSDILKELLHSKYHEERMLSLLILIIQFEKKNQKRILLKFITFILSLII